MLTLDYVQMYVKDSLKSHVSNLFFLKSTLNKKVRKIKVIMII